MRFLTTLKTLVLLLLFFNIGEKVFAKDIIKPSIPTIEVDGSRFTDRLLTISCDTDGAQIWYTLSPTSKERNYVAPIPLIQSISLSTWAIKEDVSSDTLQIDIYAGEDPLSVPAITLTGVNGVARIVSILTPDKGVDIEYTIGEESLIYTEPISVYDTTLIVARTRYEDAFSGEISYSEPAQMVVDAGTSIKLNPVVFMTSVHDMYKGETAVNMRSDISDILLQPQVSIVYTNFTNMTMETVPNDTTIITKNTRITAFATSPGYVNSDTTYIDIEFQTLEDVTEPFVQFIEAKSNGTRVFEVRNTADGYPVPTVYYFTEGKTEPKATTNNRVEIPQSEYGWVHFYASAPGFEPSNKVSYYVDARKTYNAPYEGITIYSEKLPESAGDLEFCKAQDLNFEDYPTKSIKTTGYTYFHLKAHEHYNNLVLPFPWDPQDNLAFDSEGNELTMGEDFWVYELSTLISSENLANGMLDATHIYANSAYLIKVKPQLVNKDIIFRSVMGYTFQILQTDFSDIVARTDFIIRPNKRFQKVNVDYTVYKMNDEGTAFVKQQGATIDPFTTILIAPFSFAYENETIDLVFRPKFTYSPSNGSVEDKLDHVDITLQTYPKMDLSDSEYELNRSKYLYVMRGSNIAAKAQVERKTANSVKLVFSEIKEEGNYSITIPEGFFKIYKRTDSVEPFASSKEEKLNFVILTDLRSEAYSTPAEGILNADLSTIKITIPNHSISKSGNEQVMFYHNGQLAESFQSDEIDIVGNHTLVVNLRNTYTAGGSYMLRISSGFLLVNGSVLYTKNLDFNYNKDVVIAPKTFTEDEILWINENTIQEYYSQGWIYSEATPNNIFAPESFNFDYINPETGDNKYGLLKSLIVSNEEKTKIHVDVAGVDSIVFYIANTYIWGNYTYLFGKTDNSTFNVCAVTEYNEVAMLGMRLDKTKTWEMYLYGSRPTYLYAIKIFNTIPPAAIEDIMLDEEVNASVYDISGHIVQEMIPGKVYIRNGKKFVYK